MTARRWIEPTLQAHMKAWEGSLYPAMEGLESEIPAAQEENGQARRLLQRLSRKAGAHPPHLISAI